VAQASAVQLVSPNAGKALLAQHPLPQPPQPPELDVYLNSSTSNMSPDSGIQSEGGVNNSSPLHLGDIAVSWGSMLYVCKIISELFME
jgi:hypothetical protein